MKRMSLIFLLVFILCGVASAAQWNNGGTAQVPGTINVSDLDYNMQNYVTGPLDRLLSGYREEMKVTYSSASQLSITAGEVMVSNADESVRLVLRNTAATTVTWADIDTGSEAVSTTYYVYAVASLITSETATFKISASSTAPNGVTYYKKIGSFYNNASGDISYTSNYDSDPSPTSEGSTYSADVAYQNTTSHKLLIVAYGEAVNTSGWYNIGLSGLIGDTSAPSTSVAKYSWTIGSTAYGSGTRYGSIAFIVPPGWYWKVTNDVVYTGSGTVDKIEAWEVN